MKSVKIILCCVFFSFYFEGAFAQLNATSVIAANDSLQLDAILNRVIRTFPTVKKANEAIQMSNERINMVRTSYHPNIDINGSYTRIGPVPVFELPEPIGTIKLYPNDNFNASINLQQNIYDFGRTKASLALAEENKILALSGLNMVKQELALNTINVFYSLVYLQNAIMIRNLELDNLNELVTYTQKKLNSGASTKYDLLNIQVRVSETESILTELKSLKSGQLSVISTLLDTLVSDTALFSQKFRLQSMDKSQPELISEAMDQRDEISAAKQAYQAAELRRSVAKTSNNPYLGAYLQAGEKNGYVPEINEMKLNYTAGLSVNIPVYDGNREKTSVAIAQSGIEEARYDLDLTNRKVTNEVIKNSADLKAAGDKVKQYDLQVNLANEAYSLAKVNYQAGAITNLDLLTAETNLSDSRLLLLKSKIDYVLSMYRLKASLGEKLYEL